MAESVSRRRGELNEILHIAPIRRGVVPLRDRGNGSGPVTFADRLKIILEAFQRREDQGFPSVIRLFRGIHTAKWALIDGDTRLLLSVVFDGDWHDYLAALTYEVPGFLHLIWSNCEGWERVDDAPETLFRFIAAFQVRVGFLYAHHPEVTVRDLDWLQELRAGIEGTPASHALCERITHRLAPKTLEDRRAEALGAYGESEVASSIKNFQAVMTSLYPQDDVIKAGRETFGEKFGQGVVR